MSEPTGERFSESSENDNLKRRKITVEANGERMDVSEIVYGFGKNIVLFLHGWTNEGKDNVIPMVSFLDAEKYQVLIPDLPGFGYTKEPKSSWGIEDYSSFVSAYLNAHKISIPINLIGHSFGGRISMFLAGKNLIDVKKLILIDSAGIKNKEKKTNSFRLKIYKSTRRWLERVNMHSAASKLREWYSQKYGSEDYKSATPIMRNTLVRVVNRDLSNEISNISQPTLILWGSNDDVTPVDQALAIEKLIRTQNKNCGLFIFEGAGHFSHLEYKNQTANAIDSFLG